MTSHRATLTISFDGTEDGQPRHWSETTTLVTGNGGASMSVDRTGTSNRPAHDWSALVDGVVYGLDDMGACDASLPEPDAAPMPEPAAQVSALVGGEGTSSEVVAGMKANVFTFDERALGFEGGATAAGKAWVASDNGLLLKYEDDLEGGPEFFGEGVSGKVTTRYELSDIGAPVSIDLPADCPPGLIAANLPKDAAEVEALPGLTRFTTGLSVADAAAFYRQSPPTAGSKASGAPKVAVSGAYLAFTSSDAVIEVLITKGDTRTSVRIVASPR